MFVKLTNGKKTITRSKEQYEANIKAFELRGFKLVSDKVKEVKESITDKVIELKPKKKKTRKKK